MWAKKALMSRIALRVDRVFCFNTIIYKHTPLKQFILQLAAISTAQTSGL